MTPTHRALFDVGIERQRQEDLVTSGKFKWTCADPDTPNEYKLAVLVEEVGEVAKDLHEDGAGLREELIQVAAVAVAWAESLA